MHQQAHFQTFASFNDTKIINIMKLLLESNWNSQPHEKKKKLLRDSTLCVLILISAQLHSLFTFRFSFVHLQKSQQPETKITEFRKKIG